MARNIKVEELLQTPIEKQQIELVERKGIGHPDSISDGLAEAVSRALCREYITKCGAVLHHNTDETQIVAGRSSPKFGGGEVLQPIYMLLVGRATKEFEGAELATESVALKAARNYLRNTMVNMDLERDVIIDCKLGTGSSDLRDVFKRDRVPMANDTSFGVGHAPFSELENIVYNTERQLLTDLKSRMPAIGEDMKIMGLRDGDDISLTICSGMIGRYVDDLDSYINMTQEMKTYTEELAARYTERNVNVFVNTADNLKASCVFLTVTGTSAEMGDDGSVGRGNRCNGLITPNRPMSMEATSGKNPINHIGKIYNLLSTQMARDIVKQVPDVQDVYIRLLSQIGKPIDQPLVASAQIIPKEGTSFANVKSEAEVVIDDWLSNVTKITEMVIRGELNTF
ncbi:methionine adenosyltransferase [Methanosarcina mazei]|jgi:S-adenosylmethionine synthetase|uniref:S-adenosylmethionine synthase n=8 Tax=Methanosarcina mazei TaxID=2209 RepID=METK_METMA|nr:methionine adenosyltransferase [Methanosarcina mazei]Q8PWS4.1 RecName: Full=S-adenosylmethionine synthase; Short=AdoMet synthase; AltName: Full=Methionine adenosyltransferase [Methanosarcina mazei Go1]AAM31198.1 S-adenosylmethionine synthetase [Methanosarcina mazei Go1]AGF96917.1 Archaeal S-adenosylmethionine synthetase [Methanosarcina mazei Tuc01]AKB42081.1 Archaeal S-adenosylmethionine synthetase [Methanosarcina mazei WWM610]AKB63018.1 Archaeal S-adenosylmethionine synthetase [Methanosarc